MSAFFSRTESRRSSKKEETGHCREGAQPTTPSDEDKARPEAGAGGRSSRSTKGEGGASNLGIQVVLERQRERPTPNRARPLAAQLPSSRLALYESQYRFASTNGGVARGGPVAAL